MHKSVLIYKNFELCVYVIFIQLFKVSTNHSNASFKPVPFIADILNIDHGLFFIDGKPKPLHIS